MTTTSLSMVLSIEQVRFVRQQRLLTKPPTFEALARRLNVEPSTVYRAVYGIGVGYASISSPAPLTPRRRAKTTTAEEDARMRELRRLRWSIRKIAREFETSTFTVWSRVRDVALAV
jgi:IS30 family transposase